MSRRPTSPRAVASRARNIEVELAILRRLTASPALTDTLMDDLAARCGGRENVRRVAHRMSDRGLIAGASVAGLKGYRWELTDAGRELSQAAAGAASPAQGSSTRT